MVKTQLAGHYTFRTIFKARYQISIIRTINYRRKMASVHPCQVECISDGLSSNGECEDLISSNGSAGKGNYDMVKANLLSAR